MRTKLTNNVLGAINEIEEFLATINPENKSDQASYNLDSEHAQLLQSTAEDVLAELKRLKARV